MKKPIIIIFITAFIYLLGFGMIIPILPLLSLHYGATAFQAGLLMSVFSLMQFIFSPFWGKLSDHYGRRPILMYCLLGEAASYLILAFSRSLEMLFVARILTGFFGASISTASAYISDITTEKDRTKGMATIGVAFGLGFLFGPAIGGGLTLLAQQFTDDHNIIISFSAIPVAVLCFLTFIFAYFFLEETKQKTLKTAKGFIERLKDIKILFHKPIVNKLLIIMCTTTLAMAMMEATLVLFVKDKFNWGLTEVSFGFAYVGICIIITQGVLVRRLIPIYGEKFILGCGLFLMASGFILVALGQVLSIVAIGMTLLSVGNAFANPTILGSISLKTEAENQGLTLGATQSISALGRVLGPAIGTLVFAGVSISAPFWFSAFMVLVGLTIVLNSYQDLPSTHKT